MMVCVQAVYNLYTTKNVELFSNGILEVET